MGKALLFIVAAAMLGGTLVSYQMDTTSSQTDNRQAQRQEEILAREIARTGLSVLLTRVRQAEATAPTASLSDIVATVNGGSGASGAILESYQGGQYEIWLDQISPVSVRAHARGVYGRAEHELQLPKLRAETMEVPEVPTTHPDTTLVKVEFTESTGGYCTAVYVQRAKNNNGHGNNADGVDASNPGKSKKGLDTDPHFDDETKGGKSGWVASNAQLVYTPGRFRTGDVQYIKLPTKNKMRVNFLFAVDSDCSSEGDTVSATDATFDYVRSALVVDLNSPDQLMDGDFTMAQMKPGTNNIWRIAFEDLVFTAEQLEDVKKNGYGSGSWNARTKTYGGSGWRLTDSDGYWKLQNHGTVPDFSDQVVEITLL